MWKKCLMIAYPEWQKRKDLTTRDYWDGRLFDDTRAKCRHPKIEHH